VAPGWKAVNVIIRKPMKDGEGATDLLDAHHRLAKEDIRAALAYAAFFSA
jgi:uncharacterized protein (DUF433 family)